MKASILTGKEKFEFVEVPGPEINSEEVLIRVLVCGTCYSEYPEWHEGIVGEEFGQILGHEAVGVIEKVGRDVPGLKKGDRVTGLIWQSFAEYTKAHYSKVTKVPEGVKDFCAIGEPISCLFSGVERTHVDLGATTMAIIGTGYMGLGMIQLMLNKGIGKIVAVDTREEALRNAKRFGADEVYLPEEVPEKYFCDAQGVWKDEWFGLGLDVVAEVTGTASALEMAGRMTKAHGQLNIVGYHHQDLPRHINMHMWNWKGFSVINCHDRRFRYNIKYMDAALNLIQRGKFNVEGLMTHGFDFKDINQAFAAMAAKPEGYIKGYVRISDE